MYKMIISKDPEQKYLFMADGTNNKVWIVARHERRDSGLVCAATAAMRASFIGSMRSASTTDGNVYTGEVEHAKRIQKFMPVIEN